VSFVSVVGSELDWRAPPARRRATSRSSTERSRRLPRDSWEIGEAAAGLLDDHLHGSEVPKADDGLGSDVERAFGDEDVHPEVARITAAPHAMPEARRTARRVRACATSVLA
jgi:hypothetical protein